MESSFVTYELNPFCCARLLLKVGDGLLVIKLKVCLLGRTYWEPSGAQTCMCNFHSSTLENFKAKSHFLFFFSFANAEKV